MSTDNPYNLISLTDIAKRTNKQIGGYIRSGSTKALIQEISFITKIEPSLLFKVVKGGAGQQGVWAHPEIAKHFEMWCKRSIAKKQFGVSELSIRNKLAKILGGVIEVECAFGIVDVVTASEIIEVKSVRLWKHAIGQVLVYDCEFKNKTPRIHLFGECTKEQRTMIELACSHLSIAASFEV